MWVKCSSDKLAKVGQRYDRSGVLGEISDLCFFFSFHQVFSNFSLILIT